jgi:hypothetical protein
MGGVNLEVRREVIAALTMCDDTAHRLRGALAGSNIPTTPNFETIKAYVTDTLRGVALDLAIAQGETDPTAAASRGTAIHAVVLEGLVTEIAYVAARSAQTLERQTIMLRALIDDTDDSGARH